MAILRFILKMEAYNERNDLQFKMLSAKTDAERSYYQYLIAVNSRGGNTRFKFSKLSFMVGYLMVNK